MPAITSARPPRRNRLAALAAAALAITALAGAATLYATTGLYGFNALLLRGGSYWAPVARDSPLLSPAMRLALSPNPPAATAGPLAWQTIAPGFQAGELPVLANGGEVDRILLARIDPARFRLEALNAPAGNKQLADWMADPRVVTVVNGSYYAQDGRPDTPFLSNGRQLGPADYGPAQAALTATGNAVAIHDLPSGDWQSAFAGAENAFVSYPLLLAPDGSSRTGPDTQWLANRSFVAQDAAGWIVLGITRDAFFSLARLAAFLATAPLHLTAALNLDGGPIACQAIALDGFTRRICGRYETNIRNGQVRLLTFRFGRYGRVALPIVLAITRR